MKILIRAIEQCEGGQAGFAKRINEGISGEANLVSPQQVWNWLNRDKAVPAQYCPIIEWISRGAVTRKDLRPDDWHLIWPELVSKSRSKHKTR